MDDWLLSLLEHDGWGMPVFILVTTLLSGLLSGILGLEREIRGQSAGLRTHVLLAVGSSLMMSISIYAIRATGLVEFDASRIGAGVVSGIGFLCAGCIIRTRNNIKGLTTSATLWICGGIGLACGAGFVLEAIIAMAVAFLFLMGLIIFERFLDKKAPAVTLIADSSLPILSRIQKKAEELDLSIKDIRFKPLKDNEERQAQVTIIFAYKSLTFAVAEFWESFRIMEGVHSAMVTGLEKGEKK